jgi:hypothetical protein
VAKTETTSGGTAERAAKSIEVRVLDSLFSGEKFGVKFENGVAHVDAADDAARQRAHACVNEIRGCTATLNGKPWPEPPAEERDPAKKK